MTVSEQESLHFARRFPNHLARNSTVERIVWTTTPDADTHIATNRLPDGAMSNATTPASELSLVCMVELRQFYLAPDMHMNTDAPPAWMLSKGLDTVFAEGRASCVLGRPAGTVPHLQAEYDKCMENLHRIVDNNVPYIKKSGALVVDSSGYKGLKASHRMYIPRDTPVPIRSQTVQDTDSSSDDESVPDPYEGIDEDKAAPFRMPNIPVSEGCVPYRNRIIRSHSFNPVPARMYKSQELISPGNYTSTIRGAHALVGFTLLHKVLPDQNSTKKSHIVTTINQIIVLSSPSDSIELVPSLSKTQRLMAADRKPISLPEDTLPRDIPEDCAQEPTPDTNPSTNNSTAKGSESMDDSPEVPGNQKTDDDDHPMEDAPDLSQDKAKKVRRKSSRRGQSKRTRKN
ncbi:hypothetical protein FRC12_002426 [Ceratobasidium sp. 428]|nr:hypothetical protein FRC12_002426 [Ceratobasidium sp. 428]